jgi:hypothetical protein
LANMHVNDAHAYWKYKRYFNYFMLCLTWGIKMSCVPINIIGGASKDG